MTTERTFPIPTVAQLLKAAQSFLPWVHLPRIPEEASLQALRHAERGYVLMAGSDPTTAGAAAEIRQVRKRAEIALDTAVMASTDFQQANIKQWEYGIGLGLAHGLGHANGRPAADLHKLWQIAIQLVTTEWPLASGSKKAVPEPRKPSDEQQPEVVSAAVAPSNGQTPSI